MEKSREMYYFLFVCLLCLKTTLSESVTYKAGVVENSLNDDRFAKYPKYIRQAGKMGVDILVLPSTRAIEGLQNMNTVENYNQMVKDISGAAKEAGIYVVAQLPERVRCNKEDSLYENSVVFDRAGTVLTAFRNPLEMHSNCNTTSRPVETFATDFGTSFTLVTEESLMLNEPRMLTGDIRNFIVVGNWTSELPFLTAAQFLSAWSEATSTNVIFTPGISSGKLLRTVSWDSSAKIHMFEMAKRPKGGLTAASVFQPTNVLNEDLTQYTILPLNLEASKTGYQETVCHGQFCCNFYVKTDEEDSYDSDSYRFSFGVFKGNRQYDNHQIGVQTCAILACAGSSKRRCILGFNSTSENTIFEEISITGNFTKDNSIQYPTTLTSSVLPLSHHDYKFSIQTINKNHKVTVKLLNPTEILTFGVFGRDFSTDLETPANYRSLTNDKNIYDYILTDELYDFMDYVWIRLRILIFVVSIYVLEML